MYNPALTNQMVSAPFVKFVNVLSLNMRTVSVWEQINDIFYIEITVTSTNDCQYTEFIYPKADCIILHNYIKIVSKLV
jgi:hypothetical protein